MVAHAGEMKKRVKDSRNVAFFESLEEWFYRDFSSLSHLSFPGLRQTVRPLVGDAEGPKIEQLNRYYLVAAVNLMIALYSEAEAEVKIGLTKDLEEVWARLRTHFQFSRELYDRRAYATRLE